MISNSFKVLAPAFLCAILVGCITFDFDYTGPTSGETATVKVVSILSGYYNQQVYFHGNDPCDPDQAKLIGLLHARAIGQQNLSELRISVPANQKIRMSTPLYNLVGLGYNTANYSFCQPTLAFIPESGKQYEVEFGMCSVQLFELIGGTKYRSTRGEADKTCEVSASNRGDVSKGRHFFLKPQGDME